MDKRYEILIICAVILFLCFVGNASAKTWYVDDSGGANFTRIQDAIITANGGDTIIVRDGNYLENVKVNKSLTIQSENGSALTVVQAASSGDHVFEVTEDYVNISGFMVEGATAADWIAGIYLDNADHCAITNNICTDNNFGIHLYRSGSNVIENNICNLNNHTGIKVLWFSSSNILTNNTCSLNNLHGIDLFSSESNTLSNNTCDSNNVYGIFLFSSYSNTLTNNNNSNNKYGISLSDSNDNTLTNNTMSNNNYNFGVNGISSGCYINNIDTSNKVDGKPIFYLVNQNNVVLDASTNAGFVGVVNSVNVTLKDLTLTNNGQGVLFASTTNSNIENVNASNNEGGIYLSCSSNNTLRHNTMTNNKYNFHVSGGYLVYYIHDIDTSNKIDGKPMHYLVNQNNVVINASTNAGYVGVVNSTNITVKDLTLTNNYQGIFFAYTTNLNIENINASNNERGISLFYSSNSILTNNTCSNNDYGGIHLFYSSNNTIENNTCNSNYDGISLWYSCNNSLLKNNNCSNNTRGGINHWESSNNTLTNNNCLDNGDGIYFWVSSNNTLTNNNCSDNDDGIHLIASSNNTLTNNNNSNNKYGIHLRESSNNTLINNNCLDNNDGIHLSASSYNHLTNNNCSNNECGISLSRYPPKPIIVESRNNTLANNIASNNSEFGIYPESSYFLPYSTTNNNTVTGNTVSNNRYGICLDDSYNNIVYLNNFLNNDDNAYSEESTNIWNSTSKITYTYNGSHYTNYIGNYWSDYKEKYPDAEEIDGCGIWDTPYSVNSDNDSFPLMEPWENYFLTKNIFDTGAPANPYPSIFGTHNGTIKPNVTIDVSKLYTYPCEGTGGHTEYARIWNNSSLDVNATWNGYVDDWHNLSFSEPFTLLPNETYNYSLSTGSYPQIHHTSALLTASGWINCTKFTDANGKKYDDGIPAIKFW